MKRSKNNDLTSNYSINRSKTIINFNDHDFNDELFNNSIGSLVENNIKSASLQLNNQTVNKIINKLDKRSKSNSYLQDNLEIIENKIDLIDDDISDLNDSLNDSNFYKNNDVYKKDSKNIFFLLFLYFLQGILLLNLTENVSFKFVNFILRYSVGAHWLSTIHIKFT
jgi:hypothetical protein